MPKTRLFGYSIDEEDGKLLIAIDGVLAEAVIKQIRMSAQTGKGGHFLTQLLPMSSLYKLMSPADTEPKEEALTLEELLGQQVDQSFSSFERQLTELKESIATINSENEAAKDKPS